MRIPRRLHHLYAFTLGYFWHPCPLCGQYFGGHEWRDRDGMSSWLQDLHGGGVGICPDCTQAGKAGPAHGIPRPLRDALAGT